MDRLPSAATTKMTQIRRTPTPQLVMGLIVLVLGVVFLLDNLGYPAARGALAYWPVILILIGGGKLLQARSVPHAVGGSVWTLAGTWILLNNLALVDITFWRAVRTYWPVILVAVGLSILWRGIWGREENERRFDTRDPRDVITATAFLGGIKRTSVSRDFRGAECTAMMGGVSLDLRQAVLQKDAAIDVFAMWGGVELQVPEAWAVDIQLTPILGGAEDKTRPSLDPGAPRLLVRGTVLMGGVEVKN
jgi:predicted membrane protein